MTTDGVALDATALGGSAKQPATTAAENPDGGSLPPYAPESPAADPQVQGFRRERARQRRQRAQAARLAATRPRYRDEPVRTFFSGLGQIFITLGLILGLFVVYELYVTDLFGGQRQDATQQRMEQQWASETGSLTPPEQTAGAVTVTPSAPETQGTPVQPAQRVRQYGTAIGQGFANIRIPVFGPDYNYAIVEGTTDEDLYGSPGHYSDTQYPGEVGNFALAGHRVSKGSPFNALGTMSSCDAIVIETRDEWFVYRVLPMKEEVAGWNPAARATCADVKALSGKYGSVVGREIVPPSDYPQVLPIPHVNVSGRTGLNAATERLITLTTCHPQFSDRERMIIHGILTKTYEKAPGFTPPELEEG
jgi:sortase A